MSSHPTHPSVVIRAARGSDTPALVRLAELDSAPAILGPTLVAEVCGRIVAALGTDSGARIADPFERSSGLLGMLELQAGSGRGPDRRRAALPFLPRAA